jgi:hypothetical protein
MVIAMDAFILKSLKNNTSARESRATAEQEILSSTSDDICELWNGREIIRVIGKPMTKEFIHYYSGDGAGEVGDLGDAYRHDWVDSGPDSARGRIPGSTIDRYRELTKLAVQAPNIALNVHGIMSSRQEIRTFAAIGIFLQLAALIIPGLSTYHWHWTKDGTEIVASYAYPCFLAGALAITIGVTLCSHVIDATTIEQTFSAKTVSKDQTFDVFRVQYPCTVGDQSFPGCVILDPPGKICLRTSRLYADSSHG